LLHRIDKLAALLASRQAAFAMLATHPQVRQPGCLECVLNQLGKANKVETNNCPLT
jgi:hypothetical protein